MKFINWIKSFFEYNGNTSSKRAISIICAIALVTYAFVYPSDSANNSVLVLAITAMGVSGAEKFKK